MECNAKAMYDIQGGLIGLEFVKGNALHLNKGNLEQTQECL